MDTGTDNVVTGARAVTKKEAKEKLEEIQRLRDAVAQGDATLARRPPSAGSVSDATYKKRKTMVKKKRQNTRKARKKNRYR